MSAPKEKRSKTLSDSLDTGNFDFNLGSSMTGFQFGLDAPQTSLGHGGGFGNQVAPPPAFDVNNAGFSFGGDLGGGPAVPSLLAEFDGIWQSSKAVAGVEEGATSLDALKDRLQPLCDSIGTLEWDLRNFIPPLTLDQFNVHTKQIADLQNEVKVLQRDVHELLSQQLLLPSQYEEWKILDQSLDMHAAHLSVYRKELRAVYENKWPEGGYGQLVVIGQPFPAVVKQKEKKRAKQAPVEQEPVQVKLLTGARSALSILSKIKAELVFDTTSGSSKKKGEKKADGTIINGVASMEPTGMATFEQMRFSKGTGVKIVRLKFSCTAETPDEDVPGGQAQQFTVESNNTAPFIVMTNESQFSDSAGKLLETDAFAPGVPKITWSRFANLLQLHYLMCTRQPLHKIQRPLTRADLAYIWQSQFNKAEWVDKKSFENFWKWFGPVLHKIRHQKPVPQMWEKGYIFGFISKEAAQSILQGHKIGTFLVRFSERSVGQFAVAYVSKTGAVKHYLVPQSTKKLSDVMRAKESFTDVLLCKTDFKVESFQAMVKDTMKKDGAFGEFYSSADAATPLEGYDDSEGN